MTKSLVANRIDENLIPSNIRKGKTIFGVEGSLESTIINVGSLGGLRMYSGSWTFSDSSLYNNFYIYFITRGLQREDGDNIFFTRLDGDSYGSYSNNFDRCRFTLTVMKYNKITNLVTRLRNSGGENGSYYQHKGDGRSLVGYWEDATNLYMNARSITRVDSSVPGDNYILNEVVINIVKETGVATYNFFSYGGTSANCNAIPRDEYIPTGAVEFFPLTLTNLKIAEDVTELTVSIRKGITYLYI